MNRKKKNLHLFEIEIFNKSIKVFVSFAQFKASFLNKSINFFKKKKITDRKLLNGSVILSKIFNESKNVKQDLIISIGNCWRNIFTSLGMYIMEIGSILYLKPISRIANLSRLNPV